MKRDLWPMLLVTTLALAIIGAAAFYRSHQPAFSLYSKLRLVIAPASTPTPGPCMNRVDGTL